MKLWSVLIAAVLLASVAVCFFASAPAGAANGVWCSAPLTLRLPYNNDSSGTGYIRVPGATAVKVCFKLLDLEYRYDHLTSSAGDDWTGRKAKVCSSEAAGDRIVLALSSDGKKGGCIWFSRVEWQGDCAARPVLGGDLCAETPQKVKATKGLFPDMVHVSWQRAGGAAFYQVLRGDTSDCAAAVPLGFTQHPFFVDKTGEPCKTYYYFVKALGGDSCESWCSAPDTGFRALAAVEGVTASDATFTDKVQVAWNPVDGATGYRILRNTENDCATATEIATAAGPPFDDMTADPCEVHFYFIIAVNDWCSSRCGKGDAGVRALSPPTDVAATDDQFPIRVTWTEPSGAMKYRVMRSLTNDCASAEVIATVEAPPYDDVTAACETTYFYWVVAVCEYERCTIDESDCSIGDSGFCPQQWCVAPLGWCVEYAPGTNKSGTITVPGATRIRLVFKVIDLEYTYDHLTTTAGDHWSGYFAEVRSGEVSGDTIGLTLTSNGTKGGEICVARVEWMGDDCTVDPTWCGDLCCPPAPRVVKASMGEFANKIEICWEGSKLAKSYTVYRKSIPRDFDNQVPGQVSTSSVPVPVLPRGTCEGALKIGTVKCNACICDTCFVDVTAKKNVRYVYWVKAQGCECESECGEAAVGWLLLPVSTRVSAIDDQ